MSSWGWKEQPRSCSESPLLKTVSARAGCSGLCPLRIWISPRMQTLQSLWANHFSLGFFFLKTRAAALLFAGYSTQDADLHRLMVMATKVAPDLHILDQFFIFCKCRDVTVQHFRHTSTLDLQEEWESFHRHFVLLAARYSREYSWGRPSQILNPVLFFSRSSIKRDIENPAYVSLPQKSSVFFTKVQCP